MKFFKRSILNKKQIHFQNNKIIVNARFLTQEYTGVQRYSSEISLLLKDKFDNIEFVCSKGVLKKNIAKKLKVKEIGIFKSHLWEQITLPIFLYMNGKPLLYNPGNTAPLFYRNKLSTVHDIGFIINHLWYSKLFSLVYKMLIPLIIRTSKKVLTVSKFSSSELQKRYKISETKLEIIPNGLPLSLSQIEEAGERIVKSPYILSVGSFAPRKNILNVIHAFNAMPKQKNLKLVLVGNFNKKVFGKNSEVLTEFLNDNILIYENVNDKDLVNFYKNAMCLVFIPHYEGFGLPAIEAIYYDTPIVLSNIPVFKEFFSKFAYFAQHENINSIVKMIEEAISLGAKKKSDKVSLKEEFSYDKSANYLALIIKKILGHKC